uniref:CHK kinase-like domain-containing protein n=1 Tax=Lutzomyia longipalpis TaxID=7200 RepID=A0A1B0CT37_LUTLO
MEQGGLLIDYRAIHEKEVDMLKNILPRFTKLTQGVQFSPRFYYTIPESHMMIIAMEDLRELNYRMVNRRDGLDYEHCRLSLTKLGHLHAASMSASIDADDPSSMKKYDVGLFHGTDKKPAVIQQCFSLNFTKLCEVVKNWEGFEAISEKLERMKDKF